MASGIQWCWVLIAWHPVELGGYSFWHPVELGAYSFWHPVAHSGAERQVCRICITGAPRGKTVLCQVPQTHSIWLSPVKLTV